MRTWLAFTFITEHWKINPKLLFCTSLPLSTTRWVRSSFSSLCPLSSNQCRRLNLSKNQNNFLGILRIEPGATGWEARILPLCYAAPFTKPTFSKSNSRLPPTNQNKLRHVYTWLTANIKSIIHFDVVFVNLNHVTDSKLESARWKEKLDKSMHQPISVLVP